MLSGRDVVAPRRVVIKVEVSEQGVNTRFVVTDLEQARAKVLYRQIYCARGQAENEIKDHKLYLKSDRTSCHRFEANQFRLFLHSAAYVLLDTLRREVFKGTPWAGATMETIQLRLLKLGARVQEFTDRIKISLPSSCPVAPSTQAQFDLLGLRAPELRRPCEVDREPKRLTCQAAEVGPRGLTGCCVPGRAHPTDVDGVRKT